MDGADYYANTAADYERWHVRDHDQNFVALRYISSLIHLLGATSILDVGSGSGRAVRFLMREHPELKIAGIEPVDALRAVAEERGVPPGVIIGGSGQSLPYPDQSFDIVCELSVLHHVKKPEAVVREMMRVARVAVIVGDENRFAHGSMAQRLLKLFLCKVGLFPAFYWLKTKGKGYRYSEGDGVAYSYSVFDAVPLLSAWGDRLIMVTLDRNVTDPDFQPVHCTLQPILSSFRMMVASVRDMPENATALSPTEPPLRAKSAEAGKL